MEPSGARSPGARTGVRRLWMVGGCGKVRTMESIESGVTRLVWLPNDRTVTGGCEDGTTAVFGAP